MTYQPEANDWQYVDDEWRFLYKAPLVIMTENLKGHYHLYSADG